MTEAEYRAQLGRNIRAARKARNLTQSQIAGPYTKAYISGLELGIIWPSVKALLRIATILGVSPRDLLPREEEA